MGLESATNIAALNPLWPLGTDPKAQGDDHIRMIKAALQANPGGALSQVKRTLVTASGTFTFNAATKYAIIEVLGGGGGGGPSLNTAAGQGSAGGGGGGGGYAVKVIAKPAAGTATLTIAAAAASGATGGATSYSDGASTLQGNGGSSSAGSPASGAFFTGNNYRGIGGGASGGDLNRIGAVGRPAAVWTTTSPAQTLILAGDGANSPYGSGGMGAANATAAGWNQAGNAATGYGGGGGGGASAFAFSGGPGGGGGAGLIIITEFI